MRCRGPVNRVVGVLVVLFSLAGVAASAHAQQGGCADYTSQDAAQFALDVNPSLASSLDPDGNGLACDDDSTSGQTETSVPDRTGADLQLPTTVAETPSAPTPPPATVDVVDQQPTNVNPLLTATQPSTSQPASTSLLDGRLGSDVTAFNTAHGAPTSEQPSDTNDTIATRSYSPPETASDLAVVYFNDQAVIILLTAETSWSGTEAAAVIREFLPADVTQLPQDSEVLSDSSVLIPIVSDDLASGVTADTMSNAGIPGVPGDMYMLLSTDGGQRATDIEIGIGNGDNVRRDINGVAGTNPTPVQGTTNDPVATSTPSSQSCPANATACLEQTRTEVDRLQAEIVELKTILGAGTYTDAEIDRLSEIIVSWMALDTSTPTAPADYTDIATQIQQLREDLASVGQSLFFDVGGGDASGIAEAGTVLDTIESNLDELDQQLTSLGY